MTKIVVGSITKVSYNTLVPRKRLFEKETEFLGDDFDSLGDILGKLDPDVYWPYIGGLASLEQAKRLLMQYHYDYQEGEETDGVFKETLKSLLSYMSYPDNKLEDVLLTKGVKEDDFLYMGVIFFYRKISVRSAEEFITEENGLSVSSESLEKAILELAKRLQNSRVLGMEVDLHSLALNISKSGDSFTVSLS